jgi:hypothetical protein
MDEGAPIAYTVLERGVPIYASGGEQVGTVDGVVAATAQDIFHGIVMHAARGRVFVPAEDVATLHEHGVDLLIDAVTAGALEPPHGGAPAFRVNEPGVKPSRWTHLVDLVGRRAPGRRDWKDES